MKSVKHLLLRAGLFSFLVFFNSILISAQQGVLTKRPNVPINPNVNGFLEYVPFGYNSTTDRYPLIIYINGIGSTGNGSEAALENHFTGGGYPHEQQREGSWVDAYSVNGQTFRFVIITPQFVTPMHQKIPTASEINDVLNYAIQHYRVDTSRIYVIGQSQGGGAVWDYPGTSSVYARRIAAIVPFSGVSYPIEAKANNIKFNNVAVWAFHNFFDAQVPSYFTEDYVDMINQPPTPFIAARKTIPVSYNGDGTPNPEHNSWYRWLRREVTDNGMDIYEWMLQHKKTPSTAFAGLFQEITLPVNSVQLSGGGNGPNGTAVAYSWQKLAGPGGGSISNGNSVNASASGMTKGSYVYQLTITDNAGSTATSTVSVLVNPPTERIQAENYSNMLGVRTENTEDVGGGVHVGYIDQGDWMDYAINVPAAGNYKFRFRYGSFISGGKFRVLTSSGVALDTIEVFDTGGWQRFLTRTVTLPLAAGQQTIRFESIASAGWNFNWFEVESASSSGGTVNRPPTAAAGSDQAVQLPLSSAQLNGSGTDADGSIASYAWTKISGPSAGTITSPAQAATTVTGLAQGSYVFRLTVTDNGGATGTDDVVITVNANGVPTAAAGADQNLMLPASSVQLNGSGTDPDGTVASYAWTKVSGPSAGSINTPSQASTAVSGLEAGTYVFRLTVTDNGGASASDDVTITVTANGLPTASAGPDQTIQFPVSSVQLNGSGTDADGSIASYAWTQISGPSAGSITAPSQPTTTVNGLGQGTYTFRLTVTDNGGAVATDDIVITVNANGVPSAAAGADQAIQLPVSSVQLNGSGTDGDGSIASYTWTKVSGPAAGSITSPSQAATTVTGLTQGTYVFRLTVTDNGGATGTDDISITVNANGTPAAAAGADQTIQLPVSSAQLNGGGTDADGSITSYAWTKVSGPAGGSITSPSQAATTVTGLTQGTYVFRLTVTDNGGATGTDDISITVNANGAPTAAAGADQTIKLPVNSIQLSGSGTDPNGSITAYAWTKISGPAGGSITAPSQAATSVTGLMQGTYVFRLTVTDNGGATGTDDVTITVNANGAPTAAAGADQTIQLPVSSVQLSGSGTDADGSITSYAWTKLSGPSAGSITSPAQAATTVTGLTQGSYVFRLTVTDNGGAAATDDISITVNAAPPPPPPPPPTGPTTRIEAEHYVSMQGIQTENTSDAGGGLNVGYIDNGDWMDYTYSAPSTGAYLLKLRISTPANGAQLQVRKADGSVLATFNVPNTGGWQNWQTMSATISLTQGTQVLRLLSTAASNWNVNWIELTDPSGTPANTPPTAAAGADQSITLPTSSVQLNGSATDPDGSIAAYAWTKISGPSAGSIAAPNQPSTAVNGLEQGTYIFRLTVTDNAGAAAVDDVTVTVNAATPPPPPPPSGGTTTRIEAEHYATMQGIQTENTSDAGGGLNVGYIDNGDWMDYSYNAPVAGTYTVNFRVATPNSGARFQLRKADGTVLASVVVPVTGGWYQDWMTITTTVNLAAGQQTLRIVSTASDPWNINWLEITSPGGTPPPPPPPPPPSGGTTTRIEAEHYATMQGIQTENTSDAGGGLNVGYIDNGDWMDYSYNAPVAGTYTVNFRVATPNSGARFQLRKADGTVLASVVVPVTGGWYQDWMTITTTVNLAAGQQTLRIVSTASDPWNINWLEITSPGGTPPPPPPPPPSGGTTTRIEAEHYATMQGIQTENTSDAGGGLNVGYIDNGDWMDYSYNAPVAGTYTVNFRVATPNSGARFQLRKADGTVLASVVVPVTGGWYQDWMTITTTVNLAAGQQTLRIVSTASDPWNINWLEITSPSVSNSAVFGHQNLNNREEIELRDARAVTIFPNPVADVFQLRVRSAYSGKVQVQVIGLNGIVYRESTFFKSGGTSTISIDARTLAQGKYVVRVIMKNTKTTETFIKL